MIDAERLRRLSPGTAMPDNVLRLDVLAPRLRRMKRPSSRSKRPYNISDIDCFNNRQQVACKESRSKHRAGLTSAEWASYAKGLTDEQWWAYQARALDVHDVVPDLVRELKARIEVIEEMDEWSYKRNPSHPQVEWLARIAVDELIHPMKYRTIKGGPAPCVYATMLQCSKQTWRVQWAKKYEHILGWPLEWYLRGCLTIEANFIGSLHVFQR